MVFNNDDDDNCSAFYFFQSLFKNIILPLDDQLCPTFIKRISIFVPYLLLFILCVACILPIIDLL